MRSKNEKGNENETRPTNDLRQRAVVPLDLARDLLGADERRTEQDKRVRRAWDVRRIARAGVGRPDGGRG